MGGGAPGFRSVLELGSARLVELCHEAGWAEANLESCRLSRSYVERHRRYALLAMHDRDARQFFDQMVPRIRRHRDGLQPMDVVVGEVARPVVKYFLQVSQGYWRDSLELAQVCQRLMAPRGLAQLTLEVVETAAQWTAEGRRDVGAGG